MQIYIEYVIADNMAVNLLLLYVTSVTLRQKFPRIRSVISAAVGTAFAVIMPLVEIKALFLAKIMLGLIMPAIVTGRKSVKTYGKFLAFFMLYTCLAGGICVALLGANDGFVVITDPNGYAPAVAAVAAMICVIVAKKIVGYVTLARREKKYTADVRLEVAGKSVNCKGYWDSGNRLFYKGIYPVVLSGADFAGSIPNLEKAQKIDAIKLSTVTGSKSIRGFIADKLFICDESGEKEFDNVIIGIGENDFKGFSLLLNCDL